MKIHFFSARKKQHSYFKRLSEALNSEGVESEVIWHQSLVYKSFWPIYLARFNPDAGEILNAYILEKRNTKKYRARSKFFWFFLGLLKKIEIHLLFAIYLGAFKKVPCDYLVVWNGLKYRQRIVVSAAKKWKIGCFYMENGLLPGFTTIDKKGINFLNSVPGNAEFFIEKNYPDFNFHEQFCQVDGLPEKFFYVPFQVNTDTQITRFSPWIRNMQDFLDLFIQSRKLLGDKMPTIVFRLHPEGDMSETEVREKIAGFPNFFLHNDISSDALIQAAEGIITINSTVGIEALLQRKPVLVLGQAFYALSGLTISARNFAEFTRSLERLGAFQPDLRLRNNFFYYLSTDYQVAGKWQEADESAIEAMKTKIIELAGS